MIARVAISLALVATPAVSLELGGQCAFDPETDRVIEWHETDGIENYVYDAFVEPEANNFVSTFTTTETGVAIVLNHCPTGRFLVIRASDANGNAVYDRYDDLMAATRGYTQRQVANALMEVGAYTRLGSGGVGGCDCASQGY